MLHENNDHNSVHGDNKVQIIKQCCSLFRPILLLNENLMRIDIRTKLWGRKVFPILVHFRHLQKLIFQCFSSLVYRAAISFTKKYTVGYLLPLGFYANTISTIVFYLHGGNKSCFDNHSKTGKLTSNFSLLLVFIIGFS